MNTSQASSSKGPVISNRFDVLQNDHIVKSDNVEQDSDEEEVVEHVNETTEFIFKG